MEGWIPAKILRWCLLGLLIGIILGQFISYSELVGGVAICLLALAFCFYPKIRWYFLASLALVIGIWRADIVRPVILDTPSYGVLTTFTGWIQEAPLLEEEQVKYIIQVDNKAWQKILVQARRYPAFSYGQKVEVTCKLEKLDLSYWQNKSVFSTCSYPSLKLLPGRAGSVIKQKLLSWRAYLSDNLGQMVPEPESSLLVGILWGEKSSIPSALKDSFRQAGVSHILAVSGFNVTTITALFFSVLLFLGLRRQWASLLVIVLIICFVLFSGGEASVIRAGIMGGLVIVARLLGRLSQPLNMLLLAVVGILLISPNLLLDLGFQLSFLAMTGLIYLAPFLAQQFKLIPKVLNLQQIVAETIAASLLTLPVLMLRTPGISLISPLANLLIVPTIPFIMLGGLALLPFSLAGSGLAFLSLPVWLGLKYIEIVAEALANLPLAYVKNDWLVWSLLTMGYIWFGWWFNKRRLSII